MGLNAQYQNVKSKIMLIEPLPTINKVLSIMLQEERQQKYGANSRPDVKVEETDALANSFEGGGSNRNFGKGRGYNGYQGGSFKENI